MSDDLFSYISQADEFIHKLKDMVDAEEQRSAVFNKDSIFIVTLKEIRDLGNITQYERLLDEIGEIFKIHRSKTKVIDQIESIIQRLDQESTRSKVSGFTSVDLTKMMDTKGNIAYTTSHVIDILLAAHNVKLVMDTMSEQPHFVKMCWPSLTNEFNLPLMTNGNTHIYYPYDNVNKTALKKVLNDNVFPQEKIWAGLDDVIEIVAHHDKIDMYQEWMLSLPPWDGIDRITNSKSNWVVHYLKAEPGLWSAAWARMLPLSQVWRCFKPGCKQRYYFALEGEQNIGKTSFCKALLPPNPYEPDNSYWYVSASIKNIDKDFLQLIAPGAIIEYPDLDMNRFNLNDWKRLTTDTDITFRLPYGRLVNHHPKRSISIVTTNEHRYMRDPTGETRAIPIKSLLAKNTFIDHKAFRTEYPQILAQIKEQYYLKSIEPYLTDEEMALQQEQIEIRDVVHEWPEWDYVEEFFALGDNASIFEKGITMKDIVKNIIVPLGITEVNVNQSMRNRYGQVLRKMGFEPKRVLVNGKTTVVYQK